MLYDKSIKYLQNECEISSKIFFDENAKRLNTKITYFEITLFAKHCPNASQYCYVKVTFW